MGRLRQTRKMSPSVKKKNRSTKNSTIRESQMVEITKFRKHCNTTYHLAGIQRTLNERWTNRCYTTRKSDLATQQNLLSGTVDASNCYVLTHGKSGFLKSQLNTDHVPAMIVHVIARWRENTRARNCSRVSTMNSSEGFA